MENAAVRRPRARGAKKSLFLRVVRRRPAKILPSLACNMRFTHDGNDSHRAVFLEKHSPLVQGGVNRPKNKDATERL